MCAQALFLDKGWGQGGWALYNAKIKGSLLVYHMDTHLDIQGDSVPSGSSNGGARQMG